MRGPGGAELIVGYCDECHAHLGREATQRFAGAVAAGLVGGGLALALPLAEQPLPLFTLMAVVLLASLAPLVVVFAWPRRPEAGHVAVGPAVHFVADGELACASDRYARELARANGTTHRRARFRERRSALRAFAIPLVAAALSATILLATSPLVRIVNLGPERISVDVDGRRVADVDPTSVEAPSAGVEVRITAGEHELVARTADRVVERARAGIRSGHAHLFAPGSEGYCFWLETAEYGRSRDAGVERKPLTGPPHFWVLPADLGGWFRPVPEQALAEERLTGGVVTVLRQAPCSVDPGQ